MTYLLPVASFLICLAMTPMVRGMAIKRGWVARPNQERWHQKTTALMGGIAIYAGVAIPLLVIADFTSLAPHLVRASGIVPGANPAAVLWIGLTLMFVLGLLDDFINIKPHTKLLGQIMVASVVAFLGFRLNWFVSLTGDTMVTIFWIVGITNAMNLLDNMDGLCAGIGLITALALAWMFGKDSLHIMMAALVLVGALAAFLIYNSNPASIFMGDSGSLMIGFSLAFLSLTYSEIYATTRVAAVAVPILILMVPIFDTTLVTLIRTLSGRKASTGGKDHTSHRLVLMGFTERGAVLFLYGVATVSCLSAYFVSRTDNLASPAVIIPTGLAVLLMGIYLAQLRVYPEKEFSVLRDKAYTPVLIEVTYKKHILLVLMDLGLIAFSYYLSYRLRFPDDQFTFYFNVFLRSLPAVIACKFLAFFAIGIYRGIWRYMSINDVYVYLKASTVATLLAVAAVTFLFRFKDFSKGIFIIDWFLTTGFLLGTRGSFRLFLDTIKRKSLAGDRVFIYGAGRGGEILLREILNNSSLKLRPVGFIDDDYLKVGKKLQGYPILGTFKDINELQAKHDIDGLLVSFHRAPPDRMKKLLDFCQDRDLFVKKFSICFDEISIFPKAS